MTLLAAAAILRAQISGSPAPLAAENGLIDFKWVETIGQTKGMLSATTSMTPSPERPTAPQPTPHQERPELRELRRTDILLTFFNGLLAVFTLALVIVGAYQARQLRLSVDVTKESADAAKMSAEAAREGARVAQLALQTDRPFVLVEELKLHQFDGKPRYSATRQADVIGPVTASFRLRNCGKGPALIDEIVAHLQLDPESKTAIEYKPHDTLPISAPILGAGELSLTYHTSLVESFFPVSERDQVREGRRTLSLSGVLHYKDVFKREYETGFHYVYRRPDQLFPEGIMVASADERNHST